MAGLLSKLGFGSSADVPQIIQGDMPPLQGADLAVAISPRAPEAISTIACGSAQRFLFGMLDVAGKRDTLGPVLQAAQACFRSSAEQLFAAPN
jgi:hypothetical protein